MSFEEDTKEELKKFYINGKYKTVKFLGEGSYGKAYLLESNEGEFAVIKKIPKSLIDPNPRYKELLVSEINISMKIDNHPNLVNYYQCFKSTNSYCILMEYCNGGTLLEYRAAHGKPYIEEKVAIQIIKDICNGYYQLYKQNVVHRDIKLDNIFISKNKDNTGFACKLGDYGFAKLYPVESKMTECLSYSSLGTPIYESPQKLNGNLYNYQDDIFAIGVAFYWLVTGEKPFVKSKTKMDLLELQKKGKLIFKANIYNLTQYTIDFILKCLQYEQTNRLKAADMMAHKIITEPYSYLAEKMIKTKVKLNITKDKCFPAMPI